MSKQAKENIRCPKCANEQTFEIRQSINVTLDPKLKEKLLSKEIITFKCDKCEHEAEVAFNILYHDMKKMLMIWLIHDENPSAVIEQEKAQMEGLVKNYTLRITTTHDRLIEKIMIFDDGHNDKAIELLKMGIGAQEKNTQIQELYYAGCQKIMNKETVVKFIGITEEGEVRYTFPWNSENQKIMGVLDSIEKGCQLNEEKWMIVDQEFAIKAITTASRLQKKI